MIYANKKPFSDLIVCEISLSTIRNSLKVRGGESTLLAATGGFRLEVEKIEEKDYNT